MNTRLLCASASAALWAVLCAATCAAWAQSGPLSGPRVTEGGSKPAPTLVEFDYAGKLRTLDGPPEEAALKVLELGKEERAAAAEIFAARARILDRIVLENAELLIKTANAAQANDRAAMLETLGEWRTKLQPLRARGTLKEELARALEKGAAEQFEMMVEAYWTAVGDSAAAEARAKGENERQARRQAIVRGGLLVLGAELRRSYERQLGSASAQLESFLAELDLSPEQESRVRVRVQEFASRTKYNPTDAERTTFFLSVLGDLTPEQRAKALRAVRQRGR